MRSPTKYAALSTALVGLIAAVFFALRPPATGREILVLVTLDTLRADHLAVYGYPRETAPFLTELAADSLVFESAMSSAPLTSPSHSTMLTGLYPFEHGVTVNGRALDRDVRSVASELSLHHYETGAFLSVGFLGRVAGSFSHVDAKPRNAAHTFAAASAWIKQLPPSAKAFVWVHLYDIHAWYQRTEDVSRSLLAAVRVHDEASEFGEHIAELHAWDSSPPVAGGRKDLELLNYQGRVELVDHYDARILLIDSELRRFFDVVGGEAKKHGWVITSDHGEGVWSHGLLAHAEHLYEEQLHVPLLVFSSWGGKSGRVQHPVHIIDIYPTILELAGLEPAAPRDDALSLLTGDRSLQSRTQHRVLLGQRSPFAYISRYPPSRAWEPDETFAVRKGRWKYIEHSNGTRELYDLQADPREASNLSGSVPLPFGDELDHVRRNVWDQVAPDTLIPGDVAEELRALGYAH